MNVHKRALTLICVDTLSYTPTSHKRACPCSTHLSEASPTNGLHMYHRPGKRPGTLSRPCGARPEAGAGGRAEAKPGRRNQRALRKSIFEQPKPVYKMNSRGELRISGNAVIHEIIFVVLEGSEI